MDHSAITCSSGGGFWTLLTLHFEMIPIHSPLHTFSYRTFIFTRKQPITRFDPPKIGGKSADIELFDWIMVNKMNGDRRTSVEEEFIRTHHKHEVGENQCSSSLVKHIKAPVHLVWSLVRRFDQPQRYKPFVSTCIVQGDLQIGTVREVNVKSGLPATTSKERLELLDDKEHIFSMRIVGGDHRLKNYSSIVTVHPETIDGRPGTMVIESFVVDVPDGNTKDETCYFVEALIKCNLKSLADVSERLAIQDRTEPIGRV